MSLIQALKNLDTGLELAINLGQTSSVVSCISDLKYYDILGEYSHILEKSKNRIQIINFSSSQLEFVLSFIKKSWNKSKVHVLVEDSQMRDKVYLKDDIFQMISDYNEVDIIVKSANFFLINLRDEAYILNNTAERFIKYLPPSYDFYPHILILFNNVSKVIKVNSPENVEYLGQTDIDMIQDFKKGESAVYSDNFDDIIVLSNLFVSQNKIFDENQETLEHISQSQEKSKTLEAYKLINSYCDNIGQLSANYAKLHKINQIIFVENRSYNLFIKQEITKSIQNYSSNNAKAIFLRHEKFLRGISGFIADASSGIRDKSWTENYSESSGSEMCVFQGITVYQLTLDSLNNVVTSCPLLLNPLEYFPDTQNLSENSSARDYWLNCIAEGVQLGVGRMKTSAEKEVVKYLELYEELVLNRLAYLKTNHQDYGNLSMRILQDTLDNIKRETGLINSYEKRKHLENNTALEELRGRLNYLDSLDYTNLNTELIKSLLAGNMFDWGAKETAKLMSEGQLNFEQAIEKLPDRPWLVDDLDEWMKRCQENNYRHVMVFADNSGYDFIIGVVPFVREFLRREAKVFICANSEPILNDVTFYELPEVLHKIKNICPIIKKGIEEQNLIVKEIGKNSCCLDLSFIDHDIAKIMEQVDLMIIEGMGRAVHTNLNAEFKCDTLRVAVIKDHWLSKQFGGGNFSCICKFTYGITP